MVLVWLPNMEAQHSPLWVKGASWLFRLQSNSHLMTRPRPRRVSWPSTTMLVTMLSPLWDVFWSISLLLCHLQPNWQLPGWIWCLWLTIWRKRRNKTNSWLTVCSETPSPFSDRITRNSSSLCSFWVKSVARKLNASLLLGTRSLFLLQMSSRMPLLVSRWRQSAKLNSLRCSEANSKNATELAMKRFGQEWPLLCKSNDELMTQMSKSLLIDLINYMKHIQSLK